MSPERAGMCPEPVEGHKTLACVSRSDQDQTKIGKVAKMTVAAMRKMIATPSKID
jgi:hypothetical protein